MHIIVEGVDGTENARQKCYLQILRIPGDTSFSIREQCVSVFEMGSDCED